MSLPTIETVPVQSTSNLEVAVAVLTEKVTQVIGDHERRITALETANTTRPTRTASLVSPVIATAAVVLMVADKLPWR